MRSAAVPVWRRPCPTCGADTGQSLWFNRMAPLAGRDMSYEVWQCGSCGFHYAGRLPRPEAYGGYYQEASKYDLIQGAGDIAPVDRARAHAALGLCRRHVALNDGIVDIGCGSGILLDAFARGGYKRLTGLDPAPAAARRARQAFGLDHIVTGFFHEAQELLPLSDAGLVCLTGVLEHLPLLREDMSRLLAAVAPSARVLIEVPAVERFAHDDAEPFGEFSLEHIQYFGAQSLSRFMASFGYRAIALEIVALQGATDSLFGLFAREGPEHTAGRESPETMDDYIAQSRKTWQQALERVAAMAPPRFFVYGAGSHTARLLPALADLGLAERIAGIVDANPNLHGKDLGGHVIGAPALLAQHPSAAVLVSSHKAQQAIARALGDKHPLILLYR